MEPSLRKLNASESYKIVQSALDTIWFLEIRQFASVEVEWEFVCAVNWVQAYNLIKSGIASPYFCGDDFKRIRQE